MLRRQGGGGDSSHGAADFNARRIAVFFLSKMEEEFDEELFTIAARYVERHGDLMRALNVMESARRAAAADEEERAQSRKVRARVVFEQPFESLLGKIFFAVAMCLIAISVLCTVLRSMPQYSPVVFPRYSATWLWIEGTVTIYFTLELIARVYVTADTGAWLKSPLNLADVVANLPFFIELIAGEDIGVLAVLRLLRAWHGFCRLGPVADLFVALGRTLRVIVAPLAFLAACLIVASTAMYYAERGEYDSATMRFMARDCDCEASAGFIFGSRECPRKESAFLSIPHAMWWGIATLTTVGFGDLTPRCPFGKFVASVSMVLATLCVAMPIALVGAHFTAASAERKRRDGLVQKENARAAASIRRTHEEQQLVAREEHVTPAVKLMRFLRERVDGALIRLDDPGPYIMMLLDFYFGTRQFHVDSVPAAVTYELAHVPLHPQHALSAEVRRFTLNRYVDIVLGADSGAQDVPPPDIAIPIRRLEESSGVSYRISQHHAVISVPPQFSDIPMIIRPLRGASVFVNGEPAPDIGAVISTGDVINLHTSQCPLLFQVKAVHPFALDI